MYDHRKHLKERRDRWRELGLCVICGYPKERTDIVRCNRCNRQVKDGRLRREYGITRDQYDEMLSRQGYKCAICHSALQYSGRNVHVDHDHETGKARGILCLSCNTMLGMYEKLKALGLMPKFDQYLNRSLYGQDADEDEGQDAHEAQ